MLYALTGTLNMAEIAGIAATADPVALAGIGALLLLAFGMKAAAFPVNAWLPASYHTPPAPIAALLAGLLTKVGAYALLRSLVAVLPGERDLLDPVITLVAVLTLVTAPLGAIAETNLRRALGCIGRPPDPRARGHGQLRESATHVLLPEGELRCRAGAERVPDGPAHQPSDEERVQPPPRPSLQDPPRDDAPMRGNHRSPKRARDRGVMRGSQPKRRDRRGRVGEALFRPVVQDIHPALAIGARHAGRAAGVPGALRPVRLPVAE